MYNVPADFINEAKVWETLEQNKNPEPAKIKEVLSKAAEMKGLNLADVAVLTSISDPEMLAELFNMANTVKETIYGKRLVLFAPLYISNLCANECLYCAFRATNKAIDRHALSQEHIAREVEVLINQGHKRVLLVAGESYPKKGFDYVLESIRTIYSVKSEHGEIRRVNINVAPLTVDEFKLAKAEGIGTYQIFQETYHRETYKKVHVGGKKRDYNWRVWALHRAMEAGIDDVGIGVLFGLFDYRFEIMAMMQHIFELEDKFGVGPHTISVPRMEPATNSDIASHPPFPVSDIDFRKIVAILRLAVPYTGIIMSTRETAKMRRDTFALGVSQISAGSKTNPGGYEEDDEISGQFSLGDHRLLDEVIRDVASMGYIPSFCTACYRLGRTGQDFMDLAKPGDIRLHCGPNGLSSFKEYLQNYASPETREIGDQLIRETIAGLTGVAKQRAEKLVKRVEAGRDDVYC
ncbi:iron-only hydrogenase maturation protein HydG [Draconibacterium orientale]|uniref:Iron-only hydrogenase maturation protein HydG n=1 Tax=Draconibacterium orientale TaxID=1168034 RepID=X5DXU8_9BACT|nr:[FeFe] hydrogenase H-cluster radical SAM maturase HydG [Draconibacterium orientale]AHW59101.1 thiamine biosynthesis protein ThiH [Draconibacterium orientale]SET73903.1 iron-only hydrogenase maturation protein HydG [Draconibacterium orientale]